MKQFKKVLAVSLMAIGMGIVTASANWNQDFENPQYTVSSMHQGYYTLGLVTSTSIDQYTPPVYILSETTYRVQADGTRQWQGRETYKLNYDTKEAWVLDFAGPTWKPIPTNTEVAKVALNRMFMKAYGIPFIK